MMTIRRIHWRCLGLAIVAMVSALAGCGASEKGDADQFTVGFIYIGSKQDYGYNQAHALGATAVKKMAGVKVVEEESVADTVDVQKTMKSMIELDGAKVIFPTSFGYYEPHVLHLAGL